MYFLIGVWGGPRNLYAAIKFFFTLAGSVLMLVGILAIYFYQHDVTGIYSFDILGFQKLGFPTIFSGGSSWPSLSDSRSRFPCFRSTRCRMSRRKALQLVRPAFC